MYRRKNGKWLNQKGETINMEEKETMNINENSKEKNMKKRKKGVKEIVYTGMAFYEKKLKWSVK